MPESTMVFHGLDTVYWKIKDWLQERPIQDDRVPAQVVLNGWPLVTTAYPLLEQSLKALVRVLDNTYNPYADKHSLKTIFDRLDKHHRDITDRMRKGYTAFQSLHDYVGYHTLDEFIDNIDNDYTKWRYFLLEGWENGQPATTSVEAMLEVARQTLDVLAAHVADRSRLPNSGDSVGAGDKKGSSEQSIKFALSGRDGARSQRLAQGEWRLLSQWDCKDRLA